jgi:hypothetical protein
MAMKSVTEAIVKGDPNGWRAVAEMAENISGRTTSALWFALQDRRVGGPRHGNNKKEGDA